MQNYYINRRDHMLKLAPANVIAILSDQRIAQIQQDLIWKMMSHHFFFNILFSAYTFQPGKNPKLLSNNHLEKNSVWNCFEEKVRIPQF